MAITKLGDPEDFNSAINPNYFYFDSTNKNLSGFKYLVDIYSAGTSNVLAQYSVWPRPVDGYCELNINSIKDYVSFDVNQTLSGFSVCPNTWAKYNVEVGETFLFEWTYYDYYFYSNTASTYNTYVQLSSTTEDHIFQVGDLIAVTQDSTSGQSNVTGVQTVVEVPDARSIVIGQVFTTSGPVVGGTITYSDGHKTSHSAMTGYSSYTVFNGAIAHQDFPTYTSNDFLISTATTGAFLTNAPDGYIINANNNLYLNFWSTGTNIQAYYLYISNSNGDQFRIPQGSLSASNETMLTVNAGPKDIPSTIQVLSGSLPTVKSSTTYFDVWLASTAGTRSSEVRRFAIEQDCFMYPVVEIYFIDGLGSLMPVNFELNSTRKFEFTRKDFKKSSGNLSTSQGKYAYASTEAGRTIVGVTQIQRMTVYKDQLTTDERIYFKDLIGTKQAYIKENGQLWPIIIEDTNYDQLTEFNENYLPFVMNFSYANNNVK